MTPLMPTVSSDSKLISFSLYPPTINLRVLVSSLLGGQDTDLFCLDVRFNTNLKPVNAIDFQDGVQRNNLTSTDRNIILTRLTILSQY